MIEFEKDGPFLTMRLPSGRRLFYIRPRVEERKMPWGDMRPSITYEGVDSRSQRKAWGRITTHPGKITENADQAIARDCLAHALLRLKRRNVKILATRSNQPVVDVRLHVHDEIVALAKEDDAGRVGEILSECMSEPFDWAPELPLKAVAEISKVFVKT
jgi:DNA polymerase